MFKLNPKQTSRIDTYKKANERGIKTDDSISKKIRICLPWIWKSIQIDKIEKKNAAPIA